MEHVQTSFKTNNKNVIKSILKDTMTFDPSATSDFLFPAAERIPNEKMREAYTRLYSSYTLNLRDKDQLIETLREETLKNEEQRNYIEILKQTIESNLVKHGLSYLKNINQRGEKKLADVAIDLVQIRHEADSYKKELNQYEDLVAELRREIEILRDTNTEMNMKKDKIKESLENGIRELEEAKERVQSLEVEKDYILEELNELRDYNERVLKDYEISLERSNELEKENNDIKNQFTDQQVLENKLIEYKSNFEKMSAELESLLIEKDNYEETYNKINFDFDQLKEENQKNKTEKEELVKARDDLKVTISALEKSNERQKFKSEELTTNINHINKNLAEAEKSLQTFKTENEKFKIELETCLEKNINLEAENNELNQERDSLTSENFKLKNENLQVLLENDKLKMDSSEFSNNFNKILSQYETLNKNYKNLESLFNSQKIEKENLAKELTIFKEKLNNEDYLKTKETNRSMTIINQLKHEKEEIENYFNSEIYKLTENIRILSASKDQIEFDLNKNLEVAMNHKNYLEVELAEKDKYIKALEDEMDLFYSKGLKKESEISTLYKELCESHDVVKKELQSFKNDNKKLYDTNKKLVEDSHKLSLVIKENKFLEDILNKILKTKNQEVAINYNELISNNNLLLNFQNDKSKLMKKINQLEIDEQKNKNSNLKEEINSEIEKLKKLVDSFDTKIYEKKDIIINLENKIRHFEEKMGKETFDGKDSKYYTRNIEQSNFEKALPSYYYKKSFETNK